MRPETIRAEIAMAARKNEPKVVFWNDNGMVESDVLPRERGWVPYSDYARLAERVEKLQRQVRLTTNGFPGCVADLDDALNERDALAEVAGPNAGKFEDDGVIYNLMDWQAKLQTDLGLERVRADALAERMRELEDGE